jgi:Ni/Co efflux regulator RcnB
MRSQLLRRLLPAMAAVALMGGAAASPAAHAEDRGRGHDDRGRGYVDRGGGDWHDRAYREHSYYQRDWRANHRAWYGGGYYVTPPPLVYAPPPPPPGLTLGFTFR